MIRSMRFLTSFVRVAENDFFKAPSDIESI